MSQQSQYGKWESQGERADAAQHVIDKTLAHIYLGHDFAADLGAQDAEHIAAFDPPTSLALIARLREAEAVIEDALPMLGLFRAWNVTPGQIENLHRILSRYKTTKTEGSAER